MNEQTKNAIADHAIAEYPRESCGLVVLQDGHEVYVPCRNIAATPSEHFVMSPSDYALAEDLGPVISVVHSHPGAAARPSMADKAMCEKSGVANWTIVALGVQPDGSVAIDGWCDFGPTGYVPPLIGRQFSHGVVDCYTLIRDWYRLERGIELPDFERVDKWWEDGRSSVYLDNYRKATFQDVGQDADLQVGDVLLMQIRCKNGVPNHAGVYIGGGLFIHHMYGQLSGRAVWGGMWAHSLRTVLRYKGESP